ncbi:MAG: sugar phosphate isomerase/epimerase family protein, partial [Myxococcota bacterium]
RDPVTTLECIEMAGRVGSLSVVDLNWPFAPKDIDTADIKSALKQAGLQAIAITPEIYNKDFVKGGFTNPDPKVRAKAIDLVSRAAELARDLDCDYVKLWPGQDGVDYPFQANHSELWKFSVDAVRELATNFPDLKFAIEYKPREPRNRMFFSSAAVTLLAIEEMARDNVGILLDFGHSLYGGESPAEAARLIMSRNRLFAIDVNDNFRGWDDDMVVGSVHLLETFEFFHALHEANWEGVWQLDQFPFREDPVQAAKDGVATMRAFHHALQLLDHDALRAAQAAQDALLAQRIAKKALYRALAEMEGI